MPNLSLENWFIEPFGDEGTCFGLSITEKLHEEKSPYQKIAIYQTQTFGKLMVIDDCIMLSERDNFFYHEMMSHPGLFCHPNPEQVGIIGGGDCGTLQQVLLHDTVKRVDQIEIDKRVTELSEQFFPELCTHQQDIRAHLHFLDGIQWIQDQPNESLDILIIDSTDPVGPAEGLFSYSFYQDCYRVLAPHGLLIQQSESPFLHADTLIKQIHQDLNALEFTQVSTLGFPQPVYPSGWWSCTLAGKQIDTRQFDRNRAERKPFNTGYYNADIHQAALAQAEFFQQALK